MAKSTNKRVIKFSKLGKTPPDGKPGSTPFGIFDPNTGVIRIDPRQTEDELIDTVVHELIHAAFPYLEEEAVHEGATSIAKSMWEMGYRRTRQ